MSNSVQLSLKEQYLLLIEQDEKTRAQLLQKLQAKNSALYKEVVKLLEGEYTSKLLFQKMHVKVEENILESLSPEEVNRSGQTVGNYTLKTLLGTGGMAQVYKAERTDGLFEQTVAVKLMKEELDGSKWLRQFKDERRLLARLNHKNIARIYDGGLLEKGLPYFVMEYVDGVPIDTYCNTAKLSVAERLEIFVKVCETVQFAHQNLIIHCDLKPGNILITKDGEIKLLDFGISQILDDFPSKNEKVGFAGTPEYASSEQKAGETVSTHTDIYQLGIILYKILIGKLPECCVRSKFDELILFSKKSKYRSKDNSGNLYDKGSDFDPYLHFRKLPRDKQIHIAAARETTVSNLESILKGDLHFIIRKTIASKDGPATYSAAALAEDLKAYLQLKPIIGMNSSWKHRSLLFLRRNKWKSIVSAASILLIISLSAVYLFKIWKAEEKAHLQARKAEVVSAFMIELFKGSNPNAEANGKNLNAYQLLQKGMDRADVLEAEPEVQAAMYEAIAQSYSNLNEREQAKNAIEKAIVIKRRIYFADDPEFASSYELLGNILAKMGEYQQAEETLSAAFDIAVQYDNEQMRKMTVQLLSSLAYLFREKRDLQKADSVLHLAIEKAQNLYSTYEMEMADLYFSMGTIQKALFNYEKSALMHLKVQEIYDELNIENVVLRQENLSGLGVAYIYLEEFDKAEKVLLDALDMLEELDYKDGRLAGAKYDYLSLLYKKKEEYDKAIFYSHQAMKSFLDEYDKEHIYIAVMQFNLGQAYTMLNQVDSSKKYYERSLYGMRKHYAPEDEGYRRVVYIEEQIDKLDSVKTTIAKM